MAMAAGTATPACCSAMESQWLVPEERVQWASFCGGRSSSSSRNCRLGVVSRMGGGRGRGGGRTGGGGGRGRGGGGGGRGRRANRYEEVEVGPAMNDNIRYPILRLIGENAQQIGIVPRDDAYQRARRAGLDLVLLAADSDPPVAKIMDYSKYKYEQQKKKRDQQRKAAATKVELKELKMRYNIDTHDYEVHLRKAKKFLKDGNKVKMFMPFRGREVQFKDLGMKLLKKFEQDINEYGLLEGRTNDDGRTMQMTLTPNKAQIAKAEKARKLKESTELTDVESDEDDIDESEEDEEEDEIESEDEGDNEVNAEDDSAEDIQEQTKTLSV